VTEKKPTFHSTAPPTISQPLLRCCLQFGAAIPRHSGILDASET